MRKRENYIIIITVFIMICCTACGTRPSSSNADSVQKTETQSKSQRAERQKPIVETELPNTYASKYGEVYGSDEQPIFMFDYPTDWTITQEEVFIDRETAVISNERGVTVNFSYIDHAGAMDGGDSHATMLRVDISKIADSDFTTVYYGRGKTNETGTDRIEKFMIAKLKVTGVLDMMASAPDFTDIDGAVSYAVLPETRIGIDNAVRCPNIKLCAFDYLGLVSFWADSPDGRFTEQEEKEVLKILSSFRVESDL